MKSRRRNQTALTSALRACYGSIAMWWNGIEARGQAIKPASTLCSAPIWRNEKTRKLTPSASTFEIFVRLAATNLLNLRTQATSAVTRLYSQVITRTYGKFPDGDFGGIKCGVPSQLQRYAIPICPAAQKAAGFLLSASQMGKLALEGVDVGQDHPSIKSMSRDESPTALFQMLFPRASS